MALDYVVKTVEGLSPEIAKEYVKDGDVYRLDVPGVVASEKLVEFRNNNIELKKTLEAYKGVDPAKIPTLLNLEQQFADKKLFDDGKVNEIVTERIGKLKEEHETTVKDLNGKLSTTTRQLEGLLIDSNVRDIATKSGVVTTGVDDVLLRAKTVFKIVDGVATALDNQDRPMYGRDGVTPLTMAEWMKDLNKTAPHLFEGSKGGGSKGGKPGAGNGAPLTALQKISAGLAEM